jgi:PAS domain S-box-containing protein
MVRSVANIMNGDSSKALVAGWLAAIVESSDDAIVSKTLDGIITSWNPAAQRLFGYAADEAVGRPISMLAAPGRENEMSDILERIRRGERVQRYETVRRRRDGSLVDVSLTVSPILSTGRIIGASKIARDITERKRAEQALRESEQRFRTLANTVPDIIWIASPDGTMTFVNDRWLRFCGIAQEQNAGQWPELAMHPDDRERCLEQWARALREGTDYEVEVRHRRHDGEHRWFLTRATPVRDDQGRITAWFGSTTDIHDRRQTEEQQRRLTSELSHRVKNILSVVHVLASPSRAKAAPFAEYIQMFQGRIRALSAAHSALIAGQWEWASLTRLVQNTLGPYLGEADRIRLDVQDRRLTPAIAQTLAIGLHELATNAAKYGALSSPAGRITLTGRVETSEDGDELHLIWQEDGGPEVEPPTTAGFGTRMLTQAMQYQHMGRVELDWRKEGLVCRIVLLLEAAGGTLD